MRRKFSILFFIILAHTVTAQNNYFFGYQDGFKYGCQCYDIPPKNVALVSGTFSDGYRDGKLDGVIYVQRKSSNSNNQKSQDYNRNKTKVYNNEPAYSPDYEFMERALRQKQAMLDQRRASMQNAYDNIFDIIDVAEKRNKGLTSYQLEYIKSIDESINKFSSYNFNVESNYINVMNWFQKVKITVLKW